MSNKMIGIRGNDEEKKALQKEAMRHGYMNLSAFMRDKSMGTLESEEIKTLKAQNKNLMKLLKEKEA